MASLTLYDKSLKYGDLHKGYFVCEAISHMVDGIDLRNPATVKFARLLLGNSEAVRDSIDDIASYAKKSDGILDFKPDSVIPDDVMAVLDVTARFCEVHDPDPTILAYVVAFFSAIRRKEYMLALSLFNEYNSYNKEVQRPIGLVYIEASSMLSWAEYLVAELKKLEQQKATTQNPPAAPQVAQPPICQPPICQPPVKKASNKATDSLSEALDTVFGKEGIV